MTSERERADARRFWFDTEFIENGVTIDLISIGIVATGRTWDRMRRAGDAARSLLSKGQPT